MKNQWTSTEIARIESRRHIWRDSKLVVLPMWPLWVPLASVSFSVGLFWRFQPSAVPDIYSLLDMCGLAEWLVGWPLAQGIAFALRRMELHQRYQPDAWQRWPYLGQSLYGIALAFALAPGGLLLGYSLPTVLQEISTQEIPQINLSLGGVAVVGLVAWGACIVLLSSTLALLAMRLSTRFSPVIWIVVSAYVQLSTLGGLAGHIQRITPGGEVSFSRVPPTLGVMTQLAVARLADPGLRYEYLQSIGGGALATAVLSILLLLAASLLLARTAPKLPNVDLLGICSMGGALASGVYLMAQNWVYMHDAAVAAPGQWSSLLAVAATACVVLFYVMQEGQTTVGPAGQLLWPVAALALALGMTSLQIKAGQVSHLEIAMEFAILLPLLLAALAILRLPDHAYAVSRHAAVAGFILMVAPLAKQGSIVDMIRNWSLLNDHAYLTSGVALLLVLLVATWTAAPVRRGHQATEELRPAI